MSQLSHVGTTITKAPENWRNGSLEDDRSFCKSYLGFTVILPGEKTLTILSSKKRRGKKKIVSI